ncbi:MAG: hypothetical protein CSB33_02095 [Desulfobacterales bacterium]|nr:MAG: hypothetical protein CSB33_02095 [Desulfobacterales bacterium]
MRQNALCLSILLFLLFITTLFLQFDYVNSRYIKYETAAGCKWCLDKERKDEGAFIPLSATAASIAAPADRDFLADILWLKTALYFGEHALTDKSYPYLAHLIDLITDLSPRWDYPYWFGVIILPMEADAVEDGLYFAEKAIIHHPDDWIFWFYKGFINFYYLNNAIEGAEALYKASTLPQGPKWLARLSATLATKAGRKELAIRFLEQSLEKVKDETQRKPILDKLEEVRAQ